MATPILVIDANREFGILIRQSLEDSGRYAVTLTAGGEEAVERALAERFDLAIIDFGLPDMPGAELVRRLRAVRPGLPIVAIPAGDESTLDLAGVSVEGVLSRPFFLPELPEVLERALRAPPLSGQIQWEEESELPAPDEELTVEPPSSRPGVEEEPGLVQSGQALQQRLLAALEATDALACLLIQDQQLVAFAGLRADQARALVSELEGRRQDGPPGGTVIIYVPSAGEPADRLLYVRPISDRERLGLLFDAALPFGLARRAAADFLATLLGQETLPEAGDLLAGPPPTPVRPAPRPAPRSPEPSPEPTAVHLPADWLPEEGLSAAQEEMLDELTDVDFPPPDPEPPPAAVEPDEPRLSVPDDWIPKGDPPETFLAFLEDPPPAGNSDRPAGRPGRRPSAASHRLPFTTVLVPRFPEHRLTGPVADQLRDWTERFCLAYDWRADRIEVEPHYLVLQMELIPESAPAGAIQQLQDDLSRRILEEFPQFRADLPSGRFWASDYWLSAGGPPPIDEITTFIERTRRQQGLSG